MRLRVSRVVLLVLVALAAAAATTTTAQAITISPGGTHGVGGGAFFLSRTMHFGFECRGFGYEFDTTAGTYAPGDVFASIPFIGMNTCDISGTRLETTAGGLVTVGPLVGGDPSFLIPIAIRIGIWGGCRFSGTVTAVDDGGVLRIRDQPLPVDLSDPLTAPTCVTRPGPLYMTQGGGVLPGWTTTLP